MKKEEVFEAIGEVDDKRLEQTEYKTKKGLPWPAYMGIGIAACFIMFVGLSGGVFLLGKMSRSSSSDSYKDYGGSLSYEDWSSAKQAAGDYGDYEEMYEYPEAEDYSNEGASYATESYEDYDTELSSNGEGLGNGGTASNLKASDGTKLIRTVSMTIETQQYDELLQQIKDRTNEAGGYIQSSNSGNGYYGRNAYVEVRVPYDKVDAFLENIGNYGTVKSTNDNTEDVSLQYSDTEAHIANLKTQHERILALMENATELEDIITLNQELTRIESELDSYQKTIRNYDNLVSYSTISIDITETSYSTPAVEDDSIGSRIASGLSDTMHNLATLFGDLLVWFVVNLPIFIIFLGIPAIICLIIFLIVRANIKKSRAKKLAAKAAKEEK